MARIEGVDEALLYGNSLLQGNRVRLRALQDSDLPDLEDWWRHPGWSVLQQYTVRPRPFGATSDDFKRWSENQKVDAIGYSIESIETTEFIGHVTLWGATLPERTAVLGIIIGPEFTNRGFGTEAVQLIVDYGFRQLGLNRIELRCAAFNTLGLHVYRKVGFLEEGRRREALFFDGEHHDEILMSVLQREWSDHERIASLIASSG